MVDNAIDECSTMKGDPTVWQEVTLKEFLMYFKNCIRNVATEKLGLNEKEVVLTDDYIEQRMMSKFSMKTQDLDAAIERVIDFGEARTEILMEKGDQEWLNYINFVLAELRMDGTLANLEEKYLK